MTDNTRIYEVTGTVYQDLKQSYETVRGSPVYYPRQASVFRSSSTEIYEGARFRDSRQRRSLNRTQLDRSASDSWTQHRAVGSSHAFVSQPLSSSRQEVSGLGCFFSGTQAISAGSIPASASAYYFKPSPLRRNVYKWVASASMNGFSAGNGVVVASSASATAPHCAYIDIPDSGRIVDIRFWVELMHVSASGGHPPLGQLGMAVRSPNLSWSGGRSGGGWAHPIRNYDNGSNDDEMNPWVASPPALYESSFLLWEGGAIFRSSQHTTSSYDVARYLSDTGSNSADAPIICPVWDRDRDLRVVFCDSGVRNPRDIFQVYRGEFLGVRAADRAAGSPSSPAGSGNMLGAAVSWTGSVGSPPDGWLTGPGGTAASLEWPTTGSNTGPVSVRGVYPILDGIHAKKLYHRPPREWGKWAGYRPGLRGTEMSGTWKLMIEAPDSGRLGGFAFTATYLRQWRIEVLYEQVPDGTRARVTPRRRPRRSSGVPSGHRPGLNLIGVVSGSAVGEPDWVTDIDADEPTIDHVLASDLFINGIYTESLYEIESNRTIGVTYSTSSADYIAGNYAVYTGSVPVSVNTSSYSRADVAGVLDPKTLLSGPRTLSTVIRGSGLSETSEMSARQRLSGTL